MALDNSILQLTIVLTEKCNLNCVYCYEKNERLNKISFEKVKSFLDKYLNLSNIKLFNIEFFGGEPFLEFDLLKSIYEYVIKNYSNKNICFYATTNGTLVHENIQKWIIEHSYNFKLGFSFDGPKEIQDKNRSSSFDLIDLEFFKRKDVCDGIKMTIAPKTLDTLADSVIFCHKQGFIIHNNLAFGLDWSDKNNVTILKKELDKLIEFYISNPLIEPCDLLNGRKLIVNKNKGVYRRYCGNSKSMRILSANGREYGCQLLTPLSSNLDVDFIKIEDEIDIFLLPEECRSCKIVHMCPNCYSSNLINNGNMYVKDAGFCELQKIIFRKKVELYSKLWEKNFLKINEMQEKKLLSALIELSDF